MMIWHSPPPPHLCQEPHTPARTVHAHHVKLHWTYHPLIQISGRLWKCHRPHRVTEIIGKEGSRRKDHLYALTASKYHTLHEMGFFRNHFFMLVPQAPDERRMRFILYTCGG